MQTSPEQEPKKTNDPFLLLKLAVVLAFLWIAMLFVREIWVQARLGPQLFNEFGFTITSPQIDDGSRTGREVIEFTNVDAGSKLAESGIQPGDILIEDLTISGLLFRIRDAKTAPVSFRVVGREPGIALNDRAVRTIELDLRE